MQFIIDLLIKGELDEGYKYLAAFCGTAPLPTHLLKRCMINTDENEYLRRYGNEKPKHINDIETVKPRMDAYLKLFPEHVYILSRR